MASRSVDMQCWKCGAELKNVLLPFSRYEECGKCRADLHACLGCRHYDPAAVDACREDRADFTLDKDKANFCDFFTVHMRAYRHQDKAAAQKARAALAEIFGEDLPADNVDSIQTAQTEAERALAELKRLFGESE
tara:strand:- start:46 stop:450 length:405 start_codon:yes stop_codon:yes gene_type:complete